MSTFMYRRKGICTARWNPIPIHGGDSVDAASQLIHVDISHIHLSPTITQVTTEEDPIWAKARKTLHS